MNFAPLRAFKSYNFRLFFFGQSLSLMGTWMQKTAASWIIYTVTGSKTMLGVAVFATLFPTALFSVFGGVVADRYNRHTVLMVTQVASLVQALLLTGAVIYFKSSVVPWLIGLSVVLGIINGYDVPARQSLVREMVTDEADLPNALALNSSMVNLSKLIGPTLAGFVLEHLGSAVCFGLNTLSFIPVLVSLALMKLPPYVPFERVKKKIRTEFADAVRYIRATPKVRSVIWFAGIMNLLVLPFSTLTPAFAKDVFGGGASTLGMVDGAMGGGAFIGALFLASLKPGANLSRILAYNTLLFGIGLLLFSHTGSYPLALLPLAFGAFGMMSVVTIVNTIIQVEVPPAFRGRVISVFVMVLTGMLPLGSLFIGTVSHAIGIQDTVLAEGIIAVLIAGLWGSYLRNRRQRAEAQELLQQPPETALETLK